MWKQTFYNLKHSVAGLQNTMFTIFLIILVPPITMNSTLPKFFINRQLWEARELPSRIYGWFAFCTANVVAEIPYAVLAAVIYFLIWYFPTGLPKESSSSGYVFLMVLLFNFFQMSWGQWICAFAPSFTVISNVRLYHHMIPQKFWNYVYWLFFYLVRFYLSSLSWLTFSTAWWYLTRPFRSSGGIGCTTLIRRHGIFAEWFRRLSHPSKSSAHPKNLPFSTHRPVRPAVSTRVVLSRILRAPDTWIILLLRARTALAVEKHADIASTPLGQSTWRHWIPIQVTNGGASAFSWPLSSSIGHWYTSWYTQWELEVGPLDSDGLWGFWGLLERL